MGSPAAHVVMTSSGVSSWGVAELVDDPILVFTDTCHEDADNYRFLIEGSAATLGVALPSGLLDRCDEIPDLGPVESLDAAWGLIARRRDFLAGLASDAMAVMPGLRWLFEGRDIWQSFFDESYLGNDRFDPCSKLLKREFARRYLVEHFDPADTVVYLGYDADEQKRIADARPHWVPWTVRFPLAEDPPAFKQDVFVWLAEKGVRPPRLYDHPVGHANCGAFCVRGGLYHFRLLLRINRDLYLFHEQMEEWFRETKGLDVAIHTEDRRKAPKRLGPEIGDDQLALDEGGSCSCFAPPDDEAIERVKGLPGRPLTMREIRRRVEAQLSIEGVELPMVRGAA